MRLTYGCKRHNMPTARGGSNVSKNKITEVIGLCSGALAATSFVPQVWEVWNHRPTPATAVSLPMYVVFCAAVFGWMIYGFRVRALPIVLWNTITLIFALSVLAYKLVYG